MSRHQCSDSERHQILRLLEEHVPERKIAATVGVSRGSVRYWKAVWEEKHRTSRVRPRGRVSVIPEKTKDMIETLTRDDRTLTCLALSATVEKAMDLKISASTVWRLRTELGWVYRPPRTRQFLSPSQLSSRLSFATHHLKKKTDWTRVLFSDESWFFLNSSMGKIWRKKREVAGNNSFFALL